MGTEENVRSIFQLLTTIEQELEDFQEGAGSQQKGLAVRGYGELYELPVTKIAGFLFQQAGLWDAVVAAAKSPDPNAALIDFARTAELPNVVTPEKAPLLLVALVVLLTNLEAISTFNMSMSELLERVRAGDDKSLFIAVFLDASVLHAKPVADRVSSAALADERGFFDALAKAITRTKPVRPKPHLDKVRLLMQILEDTGELAQMTDSELTEWAVNRIRVYPSSGDPLSAVRDQRRKRVRVRQGPKA